METSKKVIYGSSILLLGLLLMSSFAFALSAGSWSVRESATETKDVNFASNGVTGSGYIISGMNGASRVTYSFEQKQGQWSARTQIGSKRGAWQPVTVNYDSASGILSVPELGLSVSVVSAV